MIGRVYGQPRGPELPQPDTPADCGAIAAPRTPLQACSSFDRALGERLPDAGPYLEAYPDVTFRVYGDYDGSFNDLGFLRHFPRLRRFAADYLWSLQSFEALAYLPEDLESLSLGATRRRLSLNPIGRFKKLRELYIEGHTKDIEVVSTLKSLEEVTLRSITLPNLELLKKLPQLWSLDLKLGGTNNLTLLPQIGRLRYLELWLVRGLSDLRPIAEVTSLQYLFLQALRGVTSLPDLSRLSELRRVHVQTLKGLNDLEPIARAPALEDLIVIDMPHLDPQQFRRFVGHPTLRRVLIALGSTRKNAVVNEMLPLERAEERQFSFR
jgi:hypothetical protein